MRKSRSLQPAWRGDMTTWRSSLLLDRAVHLPLGEESELIFHRTSLPSYPPVASMLWLQKAMEVWFTYPWARSPS
eukprot:1188328-Prorocentrum_minimum.AAC.2